MLPACRQVSSESEAARLGVAARKVAHAKEGRTHRAFLSKEELIRKRAKAREASLIRLWTR